MTSMIFSDISKPNYEYRTTSKRNNWTKEIRKVNFRHFPSTITKRSPNEIIVKIKVTDMIFFAGNS